MDTLIWSYVAGGLAYLVPLALVLVVLSSLDEADARAVALLVPAAVGVAAISYVAVGFALEFGGVGLLDARHGFSSLVWEWSALPPQWGPDWGMAGFAGWFLTRGAGTPDAVALFFGHLPWILTATLIPVLVLRHRVPALYPLLFAALLAGGVAPLAGNWAHGGGWLAHIGITLGWGHGFVDFGGGALVGLLGGAAGLALLLAFRLRSGQDGQKVDLPPVHFPALALLGGFLLIVGGVGWSLNNPLYTPLSLPFHRILANTIVGMAAGMALPALYVWLVADTHHPHFVFMGGWAGWLAVLPGLPFLPVWAALTVAGIVGLGTPLLIYFVRETLGLDDPAGTVSASLWGGSIGLLAVGGLADGRYGAGWHGVGVHTYLGVARQGVSGLWVAPGFAPDWPSQMWAQLAGGGAYLVWGFLAFSVVGVALALLQALAPQSPLRALPAASSEETATPPTILDEAEE